MAEKVPSFRSGGALWFTDLTTPDSLFILPILTSLTFWVTVEVVAFLFLDLKLTVSFIRGFFMFLSHLIFGTDNHHVSSAICRRVWKGIQLLVQ